MVYQVVINDMNPQGELLHSTSPKYGLTKNKIKSLLENVILLSYLSHGSLRDWMHLDG